MRSTDGSKLKTYCDKLSKKRNFIKSETEKIQEIRNTFMTSFNENISKEEKLY